MTLEGRSPNYTNVFHPLVRKLCQAFTVEAVLTGMDTLDIKVENNFRGQNAATPMCFTSTRKLWQDFIVESMDTLEG